jgi:hypothetical protein
MRVPPPLFGPALPQHGNFDRRRQVKAILDGVPYLKGDGTSGKRPFPK